MTIKTSRRDGFYEITAPGYYFQVSKDFQRGGWTMRQWYGQIFGGSRDWSPEDHFATLREAKDEVAARCGES